MTCLTEENEVLGFEANKLGDDMSSITEDKSHVSRAKLGSGKKKAAIAVQNQLKEYGFNHSEKNQQMAKNALVSCGLGRPKSNYMKKGEGLNCGTIFDYDNLVEL